MSELEKGSGLRIRVLLIDDSFEAIKWAQGVYIDFANRK